MSLFQELSAEFPREAISWRAQSITQDGTKAMALAYIDARDVMDRLDEVVGFENWQDRYEFHGSRTVCYLSIRVEGEWITKADGAGDSDVEAEKGAISDALKRAAVKWGIGRYLYHLKSPWVPCESYEKGGKKHWKKWADDPWKFVKGGASEAKQAPPKQKEPDTDQKPKEPSRQDPEARKLYTTLVEDMRKCQKADDLARWWRDTECVQLRAKLPASWGANLKQEWTELGKDLRAKEASQEVVKDIQDTFPGAVVINDKVMSPLEAGE